MQPQPTPQSGVSSCYVFKSRLQEYAQKMGLPTPVYETSKEGPSHEPTFRSTVIVNDVRYDSLLGFFNRKAAEQSAAEVALLALSKNREVSDGISPPVHETGLCKNLLQEYAQKMNYAIPLYECQKDESRGRATLFSCTVEIGGIRYVGAAARTKKEAEIKAARTALLAIQTSDASSNVSVNTDLTVLPSKKRGPETLKTEDAINPPKPKKARFKKKQLKKQMKFKTGFNNDKLRIADEPNVSGTNAVEPKISRTDAVEPQIAASTVAVPEETQFQLKASNFRTGLNNDKLGIAEEPNVSGTNAVEPQVSGMEVEPQVSAPTEADPERTQFQLKASNFKSGLNDNKLEIAEEPNVSETDAVEPQISGAEVEPQVATPTEGVPEKTLFQLKALNFKSGLNDNKLEIAEEPNVSGTDAVEPQISGMEVEPQVAAPTEAVPEKTQFQLKASNFKSGLNDTKLEVVEEPDVSKTDAMESQVAAPSEAVANVDGSQVLTSPSNLGNRIGSVEEISSVADGCGGSCFSEVKEEIAVVGEVAPMCQMSDLEQKIAVERMQAASDTA